MTPGIPLAAVDISAKDFAGMNWVPAAWGLGPALEPNRGAADRMRHAIQTLARDVPRRIIYTHTGWRLIGDRWVYLYAGGAVGADDVAVEPGEGLHRYTLTDTADPAAIAESLRLLVVARPEVVIPLWAAVYLAPLCEPLRRAGVEPAFVLWLLGQTGAMKSTLAALFLSHFGEFSNKNLPGSFRDTENALEKRGFLAKDTLLVIDDYHPVANPTDAARMRKTAETLLRGYGDRVGRTRMRADTSIREGYPPRGLCAVTGEDVPDAGQSTTARYVAVEVSRSAVDVDMLTRCQAKAHRLPAAMRGYIEWLAARLDGLPESLRGRFADLRQRAMVESRHGRMAETVAWLHMGLETGLDYAVEAGAVNREERDDMLAERWAVLMGLAEAQGRRIEEDRPSERFCTVLRELLTSGAAYVVDLGTARPDADDGPAGRMPGFLGWRDRDWCYLLPEVAYKAVAEFVGRTGGHFPVTSRTLWKHLDADGLIEPETHGEYRHYARHKKIEGRNHRLIGLRASAVLPGDNSDGKLAYNDSSIG